MITKKIKKNICNTIVGKNIVIWSVVMLLLWAALLPLHETSQSILCFLFVKPYIKESMKLSAYIAQEESEEVKKEIALIENMRIKPQQKLMSISNAFYFFLGKRSISDIQAFFIIESVACLS